jgi:hypothetical protein
LVARNTAAADTWNHTLSLLEEKLMNLKLLYLLLGAITRCESSEQLTAQLSQKGDYLSLMIEGVIAIHD